MNPAFHHSLELTDALAGVFAQQWQRFVQAAPEHCPQVELLLAEKPYLADPWVRVWLASDFVADYAKRNPDEWFELLAGPDLASAYADGEYAGRLSQQIPEIETEDQLMHLLRRFRNREMVRIIWRDVNGLAALEETVEALSSLADACISLALDWLYKEACRLSGTPVGAGKKPQQLVVLGMGKLGAGELNLSSDVDLIFAYEAKGQTQWLEAGAPEKDGIDNQLFFIRLAQRLIQVLDKRTAEGFVFRVDMRLRPYGQSGALALNFDAMQQYYQTQGRDWERYAFIKARVIAGDHAAGRRLLKGLNSFVYRRYLDYGAVDALREMKELIRREEQRRGLINDVKLGAGGIREIEFIAQVFQLTRGGRDRDLQQRSLLATLDTLRALELMPADEVVRLSDSYRFLRRVEHALQALADQQTQKLPADELSQARMASALGFDTWDALASELAAVRSFVHKQFMQLIERPHEKTGVSGEEVMRDWVSVWQDDIGGEQASALLQGQGLTPGDELYQKLADFRDNPKIEAMKPIARQRLDDFMPRLLEKISEQITTGETLDRALLFVEAVLRRTAYLALLVENPEALTQFVRLCAASPWIARELARHPILLDELLDARQLYEPVDPASLQDQLRQQLLRIAEEDVEQQMETLRYFKRAHELRVAASDVSSTLSLMKVSDYLSFIAEAVLHSVLELAWQHVARKNGVPLIGEGVPPGFIVVAYGKLGGLELSYSSDLDLVFIHDAPLSAMTDGDKPVDSRVFFTRLAQRMVHLLTTYTSIGPLYEADMRLRPSGASGLLVTGLEGFKEYQRGQAWTWEHQALVRARVVTGSDALTKAFADVRSEILSMPRDELKLRAEVVAMREKIIASQGSKSDAEAGDQHFDLKYDPGGIVDVEFIVQYAVLAWSQTRPELLQYTDNIRILDAVEALGLLAAEDAEALRSAYISFRAIIHRLTLQQESSRLPLSEVTGTVMAGHREAVMRIWRQVFGD